MPFLEHVFGLLCASSNVWAPAGVVLPFCQRCTGLYVGAAIALVAYLWLRPKATRKLVVLHAMFLLGMIPFGYQWVEQNGIVRMTTGLLFAFGLVYFLCLPIVRFLGNGAARAHMVVALSTLTIFLVIASTHAASALAWVGFLGLIVYAALVLSNAVLVPLELWRAFQRAGAG